MALLALAVAVLVALPASAAALPRAAIDSGPPERTAETRATFGFRLTEPPPLSLGAPDAFECRLDGGAWERCTSPKSYVGLLGGTHTFEVRAAGLLDDRTPATRTWVVEVVTQVLPPATNPLPVGRPAPPAPQRRPRRRDAGGCPYAANRAGEVATRRLEAAVLCLLNRERARRRLGRLRPNVALHRAALLHSLDMWRHRYFDHRSRGGATALQRVLRAGYLARDQYGAVGEVLAWGDGRYGTPRAAVQGLMHSPPHRRVILTAAFRDGGVGVAPGVPRRGRHGGLTVTALLGRRG